MIGAGTDDVGMLGMFFGRRRGAGVTVAEEGVLRLLWSRREAPWKNRLVDTVESGVSAVKVLEVAAEPAEEGTVSVSDCSLLTTSEAVRVLLLSSVPDLGCCWSPRPEGGPSVATGAGRSSCVMTTEGVDCTQYECCDDGVGAGAVTAGPAGER